MKHIHITLEDSEYDELQEVKGKTSWHDLLCSLIKKKNK